MNKISTSGFLLVICLLNTFSLFGQVHLVKDINTPILKVESLISPQNYFSLGGSNVIFSARSNEFGWELWISDGVEATILKDIAEGPASSEPRGLVAFNNHIYFIASNAEHGAQLWKTDGTHHGTQIVTSKLNGYLPWPNFLTVMNGWLYYRAYDDIHGFGLWKLDGTEGNAVFIKSIEFYTGSDVATSFTGLNNILYFNAYNEATGYEPWRSDGTEEGTYMLKDLLPGSKASYPKAFTVTNDRVYFTSFSSSSGIDLWVSNGTEAGTHILKHLDHDGSAYSIEMATINNRLFFTSDNAIDGRELWSTDGTLDGTLLLKKNSLSDRSQSNLCVVNDELFFTASEGNTGSELWKTDGSLNGTALVKDLFQGQNSSAPEALFKGGELLYFVANDGTHGEELWQSDGTAAGTEMVKDLVSGSYSPDITFPAYVNGRICFSADIRTQSGNSQLWELNTSTGAFKNIIPKAVPSKNSGHPTNLVQIGNTIFFTADDGSHGKELWKTDGTAAGTVLVKDINIGMKSANPAYLTDVEGTLYFSADDGIHGTELWKSNGTENGTALVKNIVPGQGSFTINELISYNGILYFSADDQSHGTELWKSDGTESGTALVKDIYEGSSSSRVSKLTVAGNTLYFVANTPPYSYELWKTDGTTAGTVLVKDINPGTEHTEITHLTAYKEQLYFAAAASTDNYDLNLWKSDGSESGTMLLKDVSEGMSWSWIEEFTVAGDLLYFIATNYHYGREVWKTDGTTEGTSILRDLLPGNSDGWPEELTASNGLLFFTSYDADYYRALFVSDGTEEGTIKVESKKVDLNYPRNLFSTDNTLFFDDSNELGNQLWQTDGSACGTIQLTNQNRLYFDSKGIRLGDRIVIAATELELEIGSELYYLDRSSEIDNVCQTITFNPVSPKDIHDISIQLDATASSGLEVSYSANTENISIEGNIVTFLEAGQASITAYQAGDYRHLAAENITQTFCINPETPIIQMQETAESTYLLSSSSSAGNQWYINGEIIPGQTEQNLEADFNGQYSVMVVKDECRSILSAAVSVTLTALEKNSFKLRLYPNPASDNITLLLEELPSAEKAVTVYDVRGQQVKKIKVNDQNAVNLDIRNLAAGFYTVSIISGNNRIIKYFIKN